MVRDERESGGEARRELQIWTFTAKIDGCMDAGVFVIYRNLLLFSFIIALDGWFSGKARGGVSVHELRLELGSMGRNEPDCFE